MELIRPLLSMAVVFALLGIALWWLRRRGPVLARRRPLRRNSGLLESFDSLPLSPQHTLHLVAVGDRAVLIATHPAGCVVLECLPREALAAGPSPLAEVAG